LKILNVCARYFPYFGGIEGHVKDISERMATKQSVTVATTDPKGKLLSQETVNNVPVKRFKSWAPKESYHFSPKLKNYLIKNTENFDVVHAYCYHDLPALYTAQTKKSNKLFFNPAYHGGGHSFFRNLLIKPYKYLGKKIYEQSDGIVCVSKFEQTLVERDFKAAKGKTLIIPNGFNLAEFRNLQKQPHKNKTILSVARAEKYKGLQYLIQVLPRLDIDVQLRIVGSGPYREDLIKIARNFGVEKRVFFLKNLTRQELLNEYANADLFALLSRREAFGITVGEALLSKTPSIVAKCSALSEWVDNNCCYGIDYPVNLSELEELIRKNIGRSINYDSSHVLDWNSVSDKLLTLYSSY
jgi:glycosyltransferase involved in cell wall biosynthesis